MENSQPDKTIFKKREDVEPEDENSRMAIPINDKYAKMNFKCSQCDHQAKTKGNLKKHILSSHEGMKFNCPQCDHVATYKGSLNRHILSKHEGVKFKCPWCDHEATFKENLKTHILSKHDGTKFKCSSATIKQLGKHI